MNIPSLGTQRESHRTNQRGRWLHEGWKSNVSQQEVKAQFREDIERADTDGPSGRLGKEQSMNLVFVLGLGFLSRSMVWCACPLSHPETS